MDDLQAKAIQTDWERHPDDVQFQGDAVEWWDFSGQLWRPTVLKEILLEPRFPRKRAVVFTPGEEGKMNEKTVKLIHLRPARSLVPELGAWFSYQDKLETAEQLAHRGEEVVLQGPMGMEFRMVVPNPVGPDGEEIPEDMIESWIGSTREEGNALWRAWKKVFDSGKVMEEAPVAFDPGFWGLEEKPERTL